jgi:hypothetical protein
LRGAGRVYLVLGRAGGFSGTQPLSAVASATFVGRAAYDALGTAVAGIGDLDGDGYADLLMSAPAVDPVTNGTTGYDYGEVYLFMGGPGAITGLIPVSAARATFRGSQTYEAVGRALAGVGDVDGDGTPDWLIGAPANDSSPSSSTGAAHLVRGDAGMRGLYVLDGANGVPFTTFTGVAANETAGASVFGPGDLDGDGFDDLVIGSPSSASGSGQVYLVYGAPDLAGGIRVLSEADATFGQTYSGLLGQGIGGGGDVDGDGLPDLLLTGPGPNVPGSIPFNVYFMRGRRYGSSSIKLDKTADIVFQDSYLGGSVELLHSSIAEIDLDGDGRSELVIATPVKSLPDPGNVYVYPGY